MSTTECIIPQQVICKLGHELEEIRTRALRSIVSKVNHGIIKLDQLDDYRQLAVRLLQWFNVNKSVPMKREVLELLLQLAKNPDSADTLNEIGTVSFLTSLRNDLDTSYYSLIDEILEFLFMVTFEPEPENNKHKSDNERNVTSGDNITNPRKNICQSENDVQEENLILHNSGCYIGFSFLTLPWIDISGTDWHVLSSTNNSLKCEDTNAVSNSCNFLNDVVFQDFSPEIFIQRPLILKSLLHLIEVGEKNCKFAAVDCISTLVNALITRMASVFDAAMYSVKQDQNGMSLSGRPSAIGESDVRLSGDGQDGESSTPVRRLVRNETSQDDIDTEQQESTVIQFSLTALSCTSNLFKCLNTEMLIKGAKLANVITDLIGLCINHKIWYDSSELAKEVTECLLKIFSDYANVILYHYDRCVSASSMDDVSSHKRALLCAAVVWSRLLKATVKLEDVSAIGLSEEGFQALLHLIMDPTIYCSFPKMHLFLMSITEHSIPDAYLNCLNMRTVCDSLADAAQFLKHVDEGNCAVEHIKLADSAVRSMNYQPPNMFLTKFINWIAEKYAFGSCKYEDLGEASKVLLKMLTHPVESIKLSTYQTCSNMANKAIRVEQAVDPKLQSSRQLFFLINLDVLREICCFGITDDNLQVADAARDIFLHLIKGQFLMVEDMWTMFIENFTLLMPVLSAHVDLQSPLGKCLFQQFDTNSDHLSELTMLKANLRALFMPDQRLRMNTIPRIAWVLSKADDALYKLPTLAKLDASGLTDLFIIKPQRALQFSQMENSPPIGQVQAIANEETMFSPLFVSTIKQLAFFSKDYSLQEELQFANFHFKMVDCLKALLTADLNGLEKHPFHIISDLIPACVNIILNTCLFSKSALSELSEKSEVYHVLLRACLLLPSQKPLHEDVACLLALLLFSELLNYDYARVGRNVTINIEIPAVVFQRFKFPFIVHCDSRSISHMLPVVVQNVSKSIEMLVENSKRMYWNLPLYRDVEEMCTKSTFNDNDTCLSLRAIDVQLLKAIHPTAIIKNCVKEINGAKSHKIALLAMKTIAVDFFTSSQWENVNPLESQELQHTISRFLALKPNSTADREFLRQILQFVNTLVENSLTKIRNKTSVVVVWMWNMVKVKDGAIQTLLNSAGLEAFSLLHKELLTFISVLLKATPEHFSENCIVKDFDVTLANLMQFVLLNLNIAAAPQFYNLASLEAALNCLVHITARPSWSGPLVQVFNVTLHQLVASLIEVVAAFSVGQVGPNRNSFMGRAVIVAATQCLCHAAAEMCSVHMDEDWVNHWLVYVEDDHRTDIGLSWLIPLWSHWDPEVRIASVSVAVSISATKNGCVSLAAQLNRHNGGIWELIIGLLLDPTEASLVREQIALLMVNLTSSTGVFGTKLNEQTIESRVLVNEVSETLSYFDALLEVLQLSNFYQHVAMLLSSFYPHPRLRHKIVANSNVPSDSEVSSLDGRNSRPTLAMSEMTMDTRTINSPTFSEISAGNVVTNYGNIGPKEIIATPTLLAGILKLLRNLVAHFPSDALYHIKNMHIVPYIFRCINETMVALKKQSSCFDNQINIDEIVYMVVCILDLLCILTHVDAEMCTLVMESSNTMSLIYCLLSDKFYEMNLDRALVFTMWGLCFKLLTKIIQSQNSYLLPQSTNIALRNIHIIAGNFEKVFNENSLMKSQYCSCCLKFLGLLFSAEARRIQDERDTLIDNELVNVQSSLSSALDAKREVHTFGYQLCNRLMNLLIAIPRSLQCDSDMPMAKDIATALQMLLAISTSAKEKALQDGLLDIILKRFNIIGMHVSSSKINATKKQINYDVNLVKDFELHADILKNFMSGSVQVKTAVSSSGFITIVSKIFPWLEKQGQRVLNTLFSLFCTYTAHCPAASRSLALFGPANAKRARTKTKLETPASFSFVHVVISICEKELRNNCSNNTLLTVAFDLLCTLSLVPVCREIISMSPFLQNFRQICLKKMQESQFQRVVTLHWLHLFVNMSFSQEGQEIILNLKDGVDILLEIGSSTIYEMQNMALLIIRNLCFHPTGKVKALCTGNFIDIISKIAINGENNLQKLAISSIWALICNNQKVKVTIKNSQLIHQLSHLVSERESNHSANQYDARTTDMLKNVISMLS